MTGGELTLGAVLARLEERELTAQAEVTREQLAQLTARLDELGRAAEEVRVTRKTLLELPDPQPPVPPAPKLPDHPAYRQIMAVFAAVNAPLRARQVCEAMDMEIAPNNINDTRLKLKRLTEREILVNSRTALAYGPLTCDRSRGSEWFTASGFCRAGPSPSGSDVVTARNCHDSRTPTPTYGS